MNARACELCNGEAAIYCSSDSAFLCWSCDDRVHGANFLVARHVRLPVCSHCKGFTDRRFSGVGSMPLGVACRSCSPESPADEIDSSSSSSSACISSTESCATLSKKVDFDRLKSGSCTAVSGKYTSKFQSRLSGGITPATSRKIDAESKSMRARVPSSVDSKADGILVSWCTKLGLGQSSNSTVRSARRAFGVCSEELTALPLRAGLAASLWFSIGLWEERSWEILKRVEEISGVPAKLILAAESKLARVFQARNRKRRRQEPEPEEGWAECSA